MYKFNDPHFKYIRQETRNHATPCERILWQHLRRKQMNGYKFRRNFQIQRYIVDFYCPSARLAIEVDGLIHTHPENKEYDIKRDEIIKALNIKIIRFTNKQILNGLDDVLRKIRVFLRPSNPKCKDHNHTLPLA